MLSHRSRLALTLSAASGLLLAVVLVGTSFLASSSEHRSARKLIQTGLEQLEQDLKSRGVAPDLVEAHQSTPAVTFAWYRNGSLVSKAGTLPTYADQSGEAIASGRHLFSESRNRAGSTITGTMDLTEMESRLQRLNVFLAALWGLMVMLVAGVAWFAARSTFRPLEELTEQATTLTGEDLSLRLNVDDRAEYRHFTDQLNSLLDRIEQTARREEQFAADAAHELRTPLAIVRTKIEATLLNARTADEYKKVLTSLVPEVDRLARLVELLLRTARVPKGNAPDTDLTSCIHQAAASWLDRFHDKGVRLSTSVQDAYANIWPEECQSIVDNLLDNALRFAPPGSTCQLSLSIVGDFVQLCIEDEGPGVPDGLLPVIFERFTREDTARNNREGFGIGLSLVKNIVQSRGGRITVSNLQPGACFTVTLPQTKSPENPLSMC